MVVLAVAAVPAAAAGPPDSWDPRVSKLAQFVERERGLDFEHPVPVKFLPDDQFLKALRGDEKVTARDRRQADAFAADLRSLGLVAGDVDILAAQNSVDDASVVGFYDTERERMVVRGTDLDDVETRVTVAHELTHALQDQHFDLDALDARAHTSGEVFALDALVEGDAVAVEDAYVATLSRKEQDDYYASFDQGVTPSAAAEAGDDPAGPAILEIVSSAPYVFGPLLVAAAQQQEGKSALDDVYGDPPVTEEQAVDPVAFQRREQPRHVASPRLDDGEQRRGRPGDFGAFSLYLVLASRIDATDALEAVDGWSGDRYVGFTRDGTDCVRVAVRNDSRHDAARLADALGAWADALPGDASEASATGRLVTFTACERPSATVPSYDTLDDAVTLMFRRDDLELYLMAQGAPALGARCLASRAAAEPVIDAWYQADVDDQDATDAADARLAELAPVCDLGVTR